jgi:hypothetical protein
MKEIEKDMSRCSFQKLENKTFTPKNKEETAGEGRELLKGFLHYILPSFY